MLEILTDIREGNLPAKELPGFIWFLIGKSFWFWFVLIMAGLVYLMFK
jgi:hypothetical protein